MFHCLGAIGMQPFVNSVLTSIDYCGLASTWLSLHSVKKHPYLLTLQENSFYLPLAQI